MSIGTRTTYKNCQMQLILYVSLLRIIIVYSGRANIYNFLVSFKSSSISIKMASTKIETFIFLDMECSEFDANNEIAELALIAVHRQAMKTNGDIPRVVDKLVLCVDPGVEVSLNISISWLKLKFVSLTPLSTPVQFVCCGSFSVPYTNYINTITIIHHDDLRNISSRML